MGVIPRNENVKEEITEIMEDLQSLYVPTGPANLNTVRNLTLPGTIQ